MSEMALTADHLLVVGRGRLVADATVAELTGAAHATVRVRSPQATRLSGLLTAAGHEVSVVDGDALQVSGPTAAAVGDLAAEHGIALHELTPTTASLEEAFMSLTEDAVDFHAHVQSRSADVVGDAT
jgi:ABC-2 type transport system ATP-binding protein